MHTRNNKFRYNLFYIAIAVIGSEMILSSGNGKIYSISGILVLSLIILGNIRSRQRIAKEKFENKRELTKYATTKVSKDSKKHVS